MFGAIWLKKIDDLINEQLENYKDIPCCKMPTSFSLNVKLCFFLKTSQVVEEAVRGLTHCRSKHKTYLLCVKEQLVIYLGINEITH